MSERANPATLLNTAGPFVVTRYFLMSALLVASLGAFLLVWSRFAKAITGDEIYSIGNISGIIIQSNGGGVVVFLTLIGSIWLLLCEVLSKSHRVRELSRRIEELESELSRKPIA
jgi:hypothetical protein